jgi:hypothetical protein
MKLVLTILFTAMGGTLLGAAGLALFGVVTGWMMSSRLRGFLMAGFAAACFWLIVALIQIATHHGQTLLSLTASLINLSGASAWLLVIVSALLAFLAGGLGGWLGGSLRQ